MLCYAFTTPSQVSFCHHLSHLYPLLPLLTPFPSGHHQTVVCVQESFFFLLNPFTLLTQPLTPAL